MKIRIQPSMYMALACIVLAGCGAPIPTDQDDTVLTLATTTSTENSGLLATIHPHFEQTTGIRVKVIARGTGASLQLARDGNVDAILVHSREQEEAFVAEGYGVSRRDVMYNDFVLIGPADDPAGIKGMQNAADALAKVAKGGHLFVSRGDNSGTHVREQALWEASGVPLLHKDPTGLSGDSIAMSPQGDGYRSIGQGMGKTISYATEKRGYTLSDRGTYYAYSSGNDSRTDLVVLCEGDSRLHNPYGVIAVNPKSYPDAQHEAAMQYIEWITSPATQKKIGQYTKGGKTLFHPAPVSNGMESE